MDTWPASTWRAPGGRSSACCLQVQQSMAAHCPGLGVVGFGGRVHVGAGLAWGIVGLKGTGAHPSCLGAHWGPEGPS